ncbi:MAG: phosphoribosylformylglycinamidine cyclo-ligase [Pseudomonadota bacterium]
MKKTSRYTEAGVDIGAANEFVSRIKPLVSSTFKSGVVTDIGGFAGLFSLSTTRYKKPVLVSSTDGVGTKLKIASMLNKHDTIGIDLVAMCVNDIIIYGAQPLFFLDYFSTGKLLPDTAVDVIKGIVEGCKEAGCSLIGGETAEMPGSHTADEYDLAGFVVGVVEQDKVIDGSEISVGDKLIGLASSGLHSNGYSLVRKVFLEHLKWDLDREVPELGQKLGETLLEPTKIYVKTILNITKTLKVSGIVHVTGGGFIDNIPRVLPQGVKAVIHKGSWDVPPIFNLIQSKGGISEKEMFHVFNNGIGMILIVPSENSQEVLQQAEGNKEKACIIGEIARREKEDAPIQIVD